MATPTIISAEAIRAEGIHEEKIAASIAASISVKQSMLRDASLLRQIAEAARIITQTMRAGRRLLLVGNGGSAADAQHIAAEFVGRYLKERRALPALALSVNSSAVTAIGNDYGFENIFARQVEAFARAGDVLLAISTSGNSRNVVRAVLKAEEMEVTSIAMTGADGGMLRSTAALCLCMPSGDTPRIQEGHILTGHAIAEIVEQELFDQSE
jgi:D-sedoheptulose 7-phosphate isomerase